MTLEMKINYEKEIADFARVVSVIRNKIGVVSDEMLMQIFDMEKESFNNIVSMIKEHPDMSNSDIAEYILNH